MLLSTYALQKSYLPKAVPRVKMWTERANNKYGDRSLTLCASSGITQLGIYSPDPLLEPGAYTKTVK